MIVCLLQYISEKNILSFYFLYDFIFDVVIKLIWFCILLYFFYYFQVMSVGVWTRAWNWKGIFLSFFSNGRECNRRDNFPFDCEPKGIPLILNQIIGSFRWVHNQEENCHCDCIPLHLKIIRKKNSLSSKNWICDSFQECDRSSSFPFDYEPNDFSYFWWRSHIYRRFFSKVLFQVGLTIFFLTFF